MPKKSPWFVYLLKCRDGSLYTGITTDLKRRMKQHSQGKASKYTRAKLPIKCVYNEPQPDESSAKKRECEIKSWPRDKKRKLIGKKKLV